MKSDFNTTIFIKTASDWNLENKIKFCEKFLYQLAITNRAIWSDDSYLNEQKIEMLKWSNELNHRVWNILLELKRGEDKNSMTRLIENLKFSGQQAADLHGHLGANLKLSFEKM
ncbi:hypothetical protein K6119_08115 [Paracrocinitomix mangrovi]|uniref:hypothetical protein n=1 Tax=Paracrocinitomix mangrovi TaxID=2862509 RepID=UPI001C8E58F6|nr:hypothetical protein [Paracrocinitomix mangrovi]UKN03477.1 hypothetical protein K6119_08115 [Paracrocinitomix mangrovi]